MTYVSLKFILKCRRMKGKISVSGGDASGGSGGKKRRRWRRAQQQRVWPQWQATA